ncbi:MAG TPA: DUF692 domain-containing protein [Candidatus Udaeobacter sp.]|nr:DUF692 domain-containing protein [Candidatus Udaeobacter sp.]
MTAQSDSPLVPLSGKAGIGLRAPHLAEVVASPPAVGWVEVHPENYMGAGPALRALEQVRADLPVSLHGVGLSLGGSDGLSERHLARLAMLVDRLQPVLVSEHLSWSVVEGNYLNDLMPLPYTEESLVLVAGHIDQAQNRLGRRILVENPSSYLRYRHSTIPEPEFLAALVRLTGCGLLCDVNNIYVSGRNLGFDPAGYLAALPAEAIGEFHLAGHHVNPIGEDEILIDDHGSEVAEAVWALHRQALALIGARPTLIEWDCRIPPLGVLIAEAGKADALAALSPKERDDVRAA